MLTTSTRGLTASALKGAWMLSLVAAALLIPACETGQRADAESAVTVLPPSLNSLLDIEWRLVTLNSADVAARVGTDGKPPTIAFVPEGFSGASRPYSAPVRIAGFGGVNRYFGMVEPDALAQGRFTANRIGTTRMAGPEGLMALEQEFLAALEKSRRWQVSTGGPHPGAALTLLTAVGEPLAVFHRVGQAERDGLGGPGGMGPGSGGSTPSRPTGSRPGTAPPAAQPPSGR